jgi:hypothetical protein
MQAQDEIFVYSVLPLPLRIRSLRRAAGKRQIRRGAPGGAAEAAEEWKAQGKDEQ